MISGAVFVTPHAVRQYQRRTRAGRGMTFEQARAHLIEQVAQAHPVKRSHDGVLFRGPKPERLRLILGPGEGDYPALVTVLTRCDRDQACSPGRVY